MSKTDKKRILVFPCGSEVGLEIHQSMQYSTHFDLIGASSLDDHGRFVYEQYIGDVPMHNHPDFAGALQNIIREQRIDAIYPTMDAVAETLHGLAAQLNVRVIGSSAETSAICASKSKTYQAVKSHIPIPKPYDSLEQVEQYPIFLKPDKGYGGRGTVRANNRATAEHALSQNSTLIMQEFLPGAEFTIDCFSDRHGKLRFHGPRTRSRIKAGISVHTRPTNIFAEEFADWAEHINRILKPRGAWFFQAKVDAYGQPKLLEVAARLAGSSALFRAKGVNFALLSAFDAFDQDVEILVNDFDIEMDRALCNRYKLDIEYSHVYVDLDDCLIVDGKVNYELVAFLYKAIDEDKHICLITRHRGDLQATLKQYRLTQLFDEIVHVTDGRPKADFMTAEKAVFIDDSFAELKSIAYRKNHLTLTPHQLFQ